MLLAPELHPTIPALRRAPADVDERAGRRSLREQIARLEGELCRALTGDYPLSALAPQAARPGSCDPQMLDLGGLEQVRDELAGRLRLAREEGAALARLHAANRRRVEAMLRDPAAHRFQSVSYEDIGERRCGGWEVRPRLGLIGMLMGWWRVKISSGCPLAGRREGADHSHAARTGAPHTLARPHRGRGGRMEYETLRYEQDGHVVTLTYDRPDQHNAVNRAMNAELHHAWQRFRDDDSAFVLVITGAGETTFCAGWDLQDAAELQELGDWDAFRVSILNSPGECGYTRRADVFKPVIAAVNGYAFAAGLETALLADIRIAAENAEFGALERRWNIVGGDGMTVRLPLVVGFSRAMELIITGRRIDVTEAERIGLVNEVVARGQALVRAQELAHQVAELPQGAIRSDKESIMRGVGRTLEERLRIEAELVMSMFMRRDPHTLGAAAFKAGDLQPRWPHHGL